MIQEKDDLDELARKLVPINELPVPIQDEFIRKAEILTFQEGETIFSIGDEDDFSYYLLKGEIELQGKVVNDVITGDSSRARYAIAKRQPRQFTVKVTQHANVLRISRSTVDNLIVLYEDNQINSYGRYVNEDGEMDGIDYVFDNNNGEVDWTVKVTQSYLFSKLPAGNVQSIFSAMEPLNLKAGNTVIRQGDLGYHYFIIKEGQCEVTRKPNSDAKDVKLAVLYPGEGFGEESLLLDTRRNATVSMLTDGIVMQLKKEDFITLIKDPVIQNVNYEDAKLLVDNGSGQWLDIRFKEEHQESSIAGAMNIPLNILRLNAKKLSRDKRYVIYCDTGGRSPSAAFLLTTLGFDVCYLEGGLLKNPHAASINDTDEMTNVDLSRIIEGRYKARFKEHVDEEDITVPRIDLNIQEDRVDGFGGMYEDEPGPAISAFDDMDSKFMETSKIINANSNSEMKSILTELESKLIKENKYILNASEESQREADQLREIELSKILKMKQEVEEQIQEERNKLEVDFKRNAEELKNIRHLRQATAVKIQQENAKLKQAALIINRRLKEVHRIKQETESNRAAASNALVTTRIKEDIKRKFQKQAVTLIQQERKKALDIISKQKIKYEKEREKLIQQLKFERKKFEMEKAKNQAMKTEIDKARRPGTNHEVLKVNNSHGKNRKDLSEQVNSDIEAFTEFLDEKDNLYEGITSHQQYMQKANQISRKNKEAAKQVDIDLLNEIQMQLAS